jgi:drug/metabolite transporter (DMT)-like permease
MPVMDIILLLILSAIWGSSFIFMRYLAPLIGPIATADMRMFIAGVCLVVFFAIIRFSPQWRKNWKHFLVIGLLNSAVPFVLYSVAALYLPASMEAIFNSLSPMFGAIFAALWLGETLTARKLIGLVMGIAGVAVMSSLGSVTASVSTALAIAACLLAPACYGLAGAYIKKRASAVPPRAIAGGSQLLGGIALMPFLFLDPPPLAAISLPLVLLVLAFAVLCSAVAYLIYYRLIADVGPTKALTVTFLIPVFAMLWGAMFLGEGVTASIVAGAAIILVGTFLVAAPRRRPVSAGG